MPPDAMDMDRDVPNFFISRSTFRWDSKKGIETLRYTILTRLAFNNRFIATI